MVTSVYAFAPGFDPQQITQIEVGHFNGKSGEEAKVAAELPDKLTTLLTKSGLPALVGPTGTPGAYVISGTVTRVEPEGSPTAGTQAEARITRSNTTVGFMQINSQAPVDSVLYGAAPALLIGSLIRQAFAPGRTDFVSGDISNVLQQARAGKREGVVNNPNGPHMWLKETNPR